MALEQRPDGAVVGISAALQGMFDYCNGQRWTNPAGQIVNVTEINLAGTNECVNWLNTTGADYLDSCVAGDKNELFWLVTDSGICQPGNFCTWDIQVRASDNQHADEYMTAATLSDGSDVYAKGPGNGDLAEWGSLCEVNCPVPMTPVG